MKLSEAIAQLDPRELAVLKQQLRIERLPDHHTHLGDSFTFDKLSERYQASQIAEVQEWLSVIHAALERRSEASDEAV